MARGRVWQGVRDWFRPGDRGVVNRARREAPGVRGEAIPSDVTTRPWLGDPPGLGSAGEAVLDPSALGVAIDERELLDFLSSDLDPVPADPVFRERLREELWELVQDESFGRPKE